MSTFLELCREVESDSGTIARGSRIESVATAANRQAKIVGWVRDAWMLIQRARSDWQFMRRECTALLVPGQNWYSAADLGIAGFGRWSKSSWDYDPFSLFDPAIGVADEAVIREIPWSLWRSRYGRGVPQLQRPHEYAIGPSHELCFGATPDRAYQMRGEYRRANQVLTLDADEPDLPDDHHPAIRHRALMLLGAHDEAPFLVASASREFAVAFNQLVKDQVATGSIGVAVQAIA